MIEERPFGPYTLLRRLAVGGMAEIYLAKTQGLGGFEKLVALKLVHPHLSADPQFVRMLVSEAKTLVLLTHANIAQVFDLCCIDGTYCIAMEYVDGVDVHALSAVARGLSRPLPLSVCCYVVAEMLSGLDYAHRKRDPAGRPLNLVHRDISPQNVMLSESGEVKLVDFGIAKSSLQVELTDVGVIKGKYYYMSPEHAWGDATDRRSDVFSAGVLLHEMLTGRMLYSAGSVPELIAKVRRAEVHDPKKLRAEIPGSLSKIVLRALRPDPAQRYQSAIDMGEALRDVLYAEFPSFNASKLSQFTQELLRERNDRGNASVTDRFRRLTRQDFVRTESSVLTEFPVTRAPVGRRGHAASAVTSSARVARENPLLGHEETTEAEEPTALWQGLADDTLATETRIERPHEEAEDPLPDPDALAHTSHFEGGLGERSAPDEPQTRAPRQGGLRGGAAKPALVPPPGDGPKLGTIPPTPPLPDLTPPGGRGRPWLAVAIGLIGMGALLGLLSQWTDKKESGELDVISVPAGATVTVDGQTQADKTPLRLRGLVPGTTHVLTIEHEGYRAWTNHYQASPGTARQLAMLEPLMAEVTLRSVPAGADVYVDGAFAGRTPLSLSRAVTTAPMRIRVHRPGYVDRRTKLELSEDDLSPSLEFRLVPARRR